MCSYNGRRIDNRVSGRLSFLALIFRNPCGRQTEGRLYRFTTGQFFSYISRVHSQVALDENIIPGYFHSPDLDRIGVGFELHIVPYPDGRNDQSQFQCTLPANHSYPVEKVAPLPGIDQRDQAVTDFDLHRINMKKRRNIFWFFGFFSGLGRFFRRGLERLRFHRVFLTGTAEQISQGSGTSSQKHERELRQTRYHPHKQQQTCGNIEDLRFIDQLGGDIAAEISL